MSFSVIYVNLHDVDSVKWYKIRRAKQQVTRTQWHTKTKIAFTILARLVFVLQFPLRYTVYLYNLNLMRSYCRDPQPTFLLRFRGMLCPLSDKWC